MKQIKVVLAGLGFGACFLPIYLDHPNVHSVGILDTNEEKLNRMKADYPAVQLYRREQYRHEDESRCTDEDTNHIVADQEIEFSCTSRSSYH